MDRKTEIGHQMSQSPRSSYAREILWYLNRKSTLEPADIAQLRTTCVRGPSTDLVEQKGQTGDVGHRSPSSPSWSLGARAVHRPNSHATLNPFFFPSFIPEKWRLRCIPQIQVVSSMQERSSSYASDCLVNPFICTTLGSSKAHLDSL